MNLKLPLMVCAVCLGPALDAAVTPPDQLLPPDTLAVISIPDYAAASAAWKEQALVRLWKDPAMQSFREKFESQWHDEVVRPLEQELGVRLADQAQLLQGQLTFAVLGNGWPEATGKKPGWLLALDTRDQGAQLTDRISTWRTRLTEAGRKVRSEKIQELEFAVVSIRRDELAGAFRSDADAGSRDDRTFEVWFGQSGSVLWLGDQRGSLEQALARQAGSADPALKSNPDFATAYEARLGSAQAYGWVHLQPLVDFVSKIPMPSDGSGGGAMGMLQPSKLLPALGLQGLRSLSFAISSTSAGMTAEVRVGIPESSRTGLFKMILPDRKEAGPPAFVRADTARFQRIRVDLAKSWEALEGAVYAILPTARGVVDLMFQSVGKDQDPNYDLRAELIGNLGDDVILLEQRPATNTLAALSSAPSLVLVGAKSPEKVAAALRTVAALLPPPMNELRQREVAGHRIYSLALPPDSEDGSEESKRWFNFGAGASYLAFSGDAELLEGYLRGAGSADEPLAATEGLVEAANAVGGLNSGFFGYENDRAMAQASIEALKKDPAALDRILALTPVGEVLGRDDGISDWFDFALLPNFEQVARYFHFSVYGLNLRAEDFSYLMFSPTPPGLRP